MKQKLSLLMIFPINEITEQYIDYITKMEEMDLEVTSEFLVMASPLLEIKSKNVITSGRQEWWKTIGDGRSDPWVELVKKISRIQKFKYASKELRNYENTKESFYKPKEDLSIFTKEEEELEQIDIDELVKAFNNILTKSKG